MNANVFSLKLSPGGNSGEIKDDSTVSVQVICNEIGSPILK